MLPANCDNNCRCSNAHCCALLLHLQLPCLSVLQLLMLSRIAVMSCCWCLSLYLLGQQQQQQQDQQQQER